jgi:hypothetical protein
MRWTSGGTALKGIAVKHIALISQISTNLEVRKDLNKATIWFKQVYNTYIKGAGNDKEPGQRRQGRLDRDSGRGGRDGGRGGRSGRGGRDGRGRSDGRGRGGGRGNYEGGDGDYIPQETLDKLSRRERAMLLAGREQFRQQQGGGSRSAGATSSYAAADPYAQSADADFSELATSASSRMGQSDRNLNNRRDQRSLTTRDRRTVGRATKKAYVE